MKGLRRIALASIALTAAAFVPTTAHANYCTSPFIFFNRSHQALPATIPAPDPVGPVGGVNVSPPAAYASLYCIVDDSDTLGETPNQFIPGANQFQIRHPDLSASIPTLDVVVNGGPFVDQIVTLKRGVGNASGTIVYDSAWLDLPAGAYCIVVTSEELEEEGHTATFGGTC